MFLSNTSNITFKLNVEVQDVIYALVITFVSVFTEALEESLKGISEAVVSEAIGLNLPEFFTLKFSDEYGLVATVQASKKEAGRKWEGQSALMRMLDEGRLIVAGDKLRLTDHFTIGDLDRYGITRQYLVGLGYVETITGKDLTIANVNYHLNE